MSIISGGVIAPGVEAVVFRYHAATPALGVTTAVHAAVTLPATGTTVVTTAITAPDFARNLTITGSAAGIAGNVVIAGTNAAGQPITETIAASGTSTVVGNKAFASVTSITVPAKTNSSGDTIAIGTGAKLGLPFRLPHNTVFLTLINNVLEGTAPTVAVSATALESNTIALNSALAGTAVDAYFVRL